MEKNNIWVYYPQETIQFFGNDIDVSIIGIKYGTYMTIVMLSISAKYKCTAFANHLQGSSGLTK